MVNYLLALFLPFVIFFKRQQPIRGIIALLLQGTGAGWFIASIWAIFGARQLNKAVQYENHLDELARQSE